MNTKRLDSIDVVRGIVMIIMVLDHTRDFIHVDALSQRPTDLATTTPILFFTRWITHLCAPTFVFLSGVSAFLKLQHLSIGEGRSFLVKRGLVLIFIEFTLITFGIWWNVGFDVLFFNVIAVIGTSFIILAMLLPLGARTIFWIGITIMFTHNLFVLLPDGFILKKIFSPIFVPTVYPLTETRTFILGYSLMPWLSIALTGYGLGRLFVLQEGKRKRAFLTFGAGAIVLAIILRVINSYGDQIPWSEQKTAMLTFLLFINVSKYPPSLQFDLLFLGFMFLLLLLFDGKQNRFMSITKVYGRVPLFYFIVHWYIIHPLMFVILFLQGYSVSDFVFGFDFGRPNGVSGLGLAGVYLIWIAVVIALYPLCKWYSSYKLKHADRKWLQYL